jgi:hypothetical protein
MDINSCNCQCLELSEMELMGTSFRAFQDIFEDFTFQRKIQ